MKLSQTCRKDIVLVFEITCAVRDGNFSLNVASLLVTQSNFSRNKTFEKLHLCFAELAILYAQSIQREARRK